MDPLLLFCCKSCLRGEDNKEYYTLLGLDPNNRSNITSDEIKKAYKKLSLTLHPDKLAQKGIEVTNQHKTDFLKLKEAYDVLSDSKRRKLYDQIGEFGLKMAENPTPSPETMGILIKNFQKNRVDVFLVALVVAMIFASLFILPILFSLKCDGSLNSSVKWIALWSPMWIVDVVFLIAAFMLFTMPSASSHESDSSNNNNNNSNTSGDSENNTDSESKIPLSFKLFNLVTTILFVLIQVFVLIRLDDEIDWNWFKVFIPWYLYEGVWFLSILPNLFTPVKKPISSSKSHTDDDTLDEELIVIRAKSEMEYYEKTVGKWREIRSMVTILLRFWFGIFLALKLDDNVDWNWGLVMLPIWIYLFAQYCFVISNRMWGTSLIQSSEAAILASGGDISSIDPSLAVRHQVGTELVQGSSGDCVFQFFPIYLAILLVSRLQLKDFSTFIILLPIFIILGCCCCVVFCGLLCFGSVDPDELSAAFTNNDQGNNSDSTHSNSNNTTSTISKPFGDVESQYGGHIYGQNSNSNNNDSDTYIPPNLDSSSAVYHTNSSAYGTFETTPAYAQSSSLSAAAATATTVPMNSSPTEETSSSSVLIEID